MSLKAVMSYQEQKQAWLTADTATDTETGLCLHPAAPDHVAQVLSQASTISAPVAMSEISAKGLEYPQWLSLERLKKIDHSNSADFIVRVQTGVTFGELDAQLAQSEQMFPLRYPADMALSQILAEDRPALETGARGFPRDYVLKSEIATPDGQLTYSGADVVKNVTGYDLHKLYVGSRNRYGILTEVTLKLMARPKARYRVTADAESFEIACTLVEEVRRCPVPPLICEIVQVSEGWQILAEMNGSAEWLAGALANWQKTASPLWQASLENGQTDSDSKSEVTGIEVARTWPTDVAVLEIVTPLAEWASVAQSIIPIAKQGEWRLQVRPLAGLIYVIAPAESLSAQQNLLQQVLQHSQSGFVQWVQWPAAAYAALASGNAFWNWARQLNAPSDFVQQSLLKAIKQSYDPQGVLWTPDCEM